VLRVGDANDADLLDRALHTALKETERPSLIIVDSHIAWGAPNKQDTSAAHGEPLGDEEIRLTKERYGWPPEAKFLVPEETRAYTDRSIERGRQAEEEWNGRLAAYKAAHPELAMEWERMQSGGLPDAWDQNIPTFPPDEKGVAGRDASQKVLNAIAPRVPWLIGGAADLAPSTKTRMNEGGDFQAGEYEGRNFHFGIREHAMGAILNGMALSRVRPYGSGFLIFSDYMRAPIRLSSLMEIPVLYIFTHDSIGVGEDGPTHQPIEQLISLRAIPQLLVIRPADANEVAESWRVMMTSTHHPIALILSRQPLPTVDRTKYAAASGLKQGAYVLADSDGSPEVILMGTGSELQLCVAAYEQLKGEGVKSRVVSMPCWELFERQPEEYRESVLPASVRARVAVEAGTSLGWRRYTGIDGRIIARRDFGASAPLKELLKQFGFTVEKVVEAARESMAAVHK
jgi:transketolase